MQLILEGILKYFIPSESNCSEITIKQHVVFIIFLGKIMIMKVSRANTRTSHMHYLL